MIFKLIGVTKHYHQRTIHRNERNPVNVAFLIKTRPKTELGWKPCFRDREPKLCSPNFREYGLLKTEDGRKKLAQAKLSPNLLRLSHGTEDPDLIIETLRDALRAT